MKGGWLLRGLSVYNMSATKMHITYMQLFFRRINEESELVSESGTPPESIPQHINRLPDIYPLY